MANRSKGPRAEHPRLVGFSESENEVVEAAAEAKGQKTNAYIRDSAVRRACRELGVERPGGE